MTISTGQSTISMPIFNSFLSLPEGGYTPVASTRSRATAIATWVAGAEGAEGTEKNCGQGG